MSDDIVNVTCPTCGKAVEWSPTSPFRPFCSKRRQLIDLGEWAEEENASQAMCKLPIAMSGAMKPAIERNAPAALYLPSQATRFTPDAAPDFHLTLVIPASC